jgi:hypothetical protein
MLEIQGNSIFVPVEGKEIGASAAIVRASLAILHHRRIVPDHLTFRRLNLDDLRSQVGKEHGTVGPCQNSGKVQNPNSFQSFSRHSIDSFLLKIDPPPQPSHPTASVSPQPLNRC